MWNQAILALIIPFVLRQLAQFGREIDWPRIKADFEVRVRKLVPGEFFDNAAVALANRVIDAVAESLKGIDTLQPIIDHLIGGNHKAAGDELAKAIAASGDKEVCKALALEGAAVDVEAAV